MTNHLENVELATNKASQKLAHARARIDQGDTTNARMEIAAAEDALAVAKRDLQLAQIDNERFFQAGDILAELFTRRNR